MAYLVMRTRYLQDLMYSFLKFLFPQSSPTPLGRQAGRQARHCWHTELSPSLTDPRLPATCTGCGKEPGGTSSQQQLASNRTSSVLDCVTAELTGLASEDKDSWCVCSNKRNQFNFQITSALIVVWAGIPKRRGRAVDKTHTGHYLQCWV